MVLRAFLARRLSLRLLYKKIVPRAITALDIINRKEIILLRETIKPNPSRSILTTLPAVLPRIKEILVQSGARLSTALPLIPVFHYRWAPCVHNNLLGGLSLGLPVLYLREKIVLKVR